MLLFAAVMCAVLTAAMGDRPRQLSQLRGAAEEEKPGQRGTSSPFTMSNVTVPLLAHSGVHHVQLYVGNPPQRQTLIVDTGSRLMSFACKPCRTCGTHTNPYYDLDLSSTVAVPECGNCRLAGISSCALTSDHCAINQKYTEGSSWSAYEVEDLVWLGTDDIENSLEDYMQMAVPYSFGCQISTKGLFRKQYADGILGLARHGTSLMKNLASAGVIPKDAFSLCLTREGGQMAVGGTHPGIRHTQPMQTVPLYHEHGFYSVEVLSVSVGNVRVISNTIPETESILDSFNSGKGTILDTGTTDTYFPQAIAKDFKQALAKVMSGTDVRIIDLFGGKRTHGFTYGDFQAFPNINIGLTNGVELAMKPQHFLEGVPMNVTNGEVIPWFSTRVLTNRVYAGEKQGAVLGANAMFGYEVFYDTQGHQVGIAEANCYSLKSTFQMDRAEVV